jgi:hypothetical protein
VAGRLGFPFESVDPHRGRLQIRKVIFCDYRGDPAILGSASGVAVAI